MIFRRFVFAALCLSTSWAFASGSAIPKNGSDRDLQNGVLVDHYYRAYCESDDSAIANNPRAEANARYLRIDHGQLVEAMSFRINHIGVESNTLIVAIQVNPVRCLSRNANNTLSYQWQILNADRQDQLVAVAWKEMFMGSWHLTEFSSDGYGTNSVGILRIDLKKFLSSRQWDSLAKGNTEEIYSSFYHQIGPNSLELYDLPFAGDRYRAHIALGIALKQNSSGNVEVIAIDPNAHSPR